MAPLRWSWTDVPHLGLVGRRGLSHAAVSFCTCLPAAATGSSGFASRAHRRVAARALRSGRRQGRPIADFNWLVNDDINTGDPAFTEENVTDCLPRALRSMRSRLKPALAIYQHAGVGGGGRSRIARGHPFTHPQAIRR